MLSFELFCNSVGFVLNDIEDFEVSSNSDGFIHRHFEAIPQAASDILDANALSVESVHNDNESVVPDNNDVIAELPHEPVVVSDSNTTRVDGHHHSNNGAEDSHSAVCKPLPEAAMGSFKTRIVSEYLDSFIPSEFRHRTFPRQILEVVIPHHFLFNWWRSVRCAIGTFSHLLAVLFFASLLAYSEYADDGQCEALSLETACVSPKSVLFGRPKCQWSPGSQYCGVDVPAAQPATLLQLAALIVLASVLYSIAMEALFPPLRDDEGRELSSAHTTSKEAPSTAPELFEEDEFAWLLRRGGRRHGLLLAARLEKLRRLSELSAAEESSFLGLKALREGLTLPARRPPKASFRWVVSFQQWGVRRTMRTRRPSAGGALGP